MKKPRTASDGLNRPRSASTPNLVFDWNNLEKELASQDLEMKSGIDFDVGVGVGGYDDVDANENEKLSQQLLCRPLLSIKPTTFDETSSRRQRLVNVGIVVNIDVDVGEEPVSRYTKFFDV